MTKFAIRYAIAFLLLIPAQAIVFDRAILFNVAVPMVFLYLITTLPVTLSTNLSTLLGFLAGLLLDVFCDTPGLNALCCTVLAFVRKPVFHLYISMDDDLAGRSPSQKSMGMAPFMKYILTMVLIYCVMLFTIEAFQLLAFRLLILRITTSTIYTFILIYALDCLTSQQREHS